MANDLSIGAIGPSAAPSLKQQLVSFGVAILVLIPLAILYREFLGDRAPASTVTVRNIVYQGWTNALSLANEQAEVVVVPSIGRVMQFRFLGESGPFWENPALYGKAPDPLSTEWLNFGGDKTWPAPQAEWSKWTSRGWPPPAAFDAEAVQAEVKEDRVILRSEIDPAYGIRWERELRLDPLQARLTIVTRYHKAQETPLTNAVGVWVITQLQDPLAVFIPRPKPSLFGEGYDRQSETAPPSLSLDDSWIRLARDRKAPYKIGTDASTLLWVGERVALRIDSPRQTGRHPDHGSSAEVYTNGDPLSYVELEMLGPLQVLSPGMTLSHTNTYSLFLRQEKGVEEEARRILKL